ncbi:hypothetical protein RUM43_009757 [Polyplax serrata]|uniref:Uncharacterized protein n=1 Tax=Polyplax serrata TaxID=468196 RepID=A0AAN8PKF3_POLSC
MHDAIPVEKLLFSDHFFVLGVVWSRRFPGKNWHGVRLPFEQEKEGMRRRRRRKREKSKRSFEAPKIVQESLFGPSAGKRETPLGNLNRIIRRPCPCKCATAQGKPFPLEGTSFHFA